VVHCADGATAAQMQRRLDGIYLSSSAAAPLSARLCRSNQQQAGGHAAHADASHHHHHHHHNHAQHHHPRTQHPRDSPVAWQHYAYAAAGGAGGPYGVYMPSPYQQPFPSPAVAAGPLGGYHRAGATAAAALPTAGTVPIAPDYGGGYGRYAGGGYGDGGAGGASTAPAMDPRFLPYAPPPVAGPSAFGPGGPLGGRPGHACPYCDRGTPVIVRRLPSDHTQSERAVIELLQPFGYVAFAEAWGEGRAIAAFADPQAAKLAVECLCDGRHEVDFFDCAAAGTGAESY